MAFTLATWSAITFFILLDGLVLLDLVFCGHTSWYEQDIESVVQSYVGIEEAMELVAEIAKIMHEDEVLKDLSSERDPEEERVMTRGRNLHTLQIPAEIETFTIFWCRYESVGVCPCQARDGTDLTISIQRLVTMLAQTPSPSETYGGASVQSLRSICTKIRKFFKDGFQHLINTFTRRSVDSSHHHVRRHHSRIGLTLPLKLRLFFGTGFAQEEKRKRKSY